MLQENPRNFDGVRGRSLLKRSARYRDETKAAPGDERIRRGALPDEHDFDYLRLRCASADRADLRTLKRLEIQLPAVAVRRAPARAMSHPAPG